MKVENIEIQLCPTLQMLADFFMKPLQGSLFQKFRDMILEYSHISCQSLPRSMLEIEPRLMAGAFIDKNRKDMKCITMDHVDMTVTVDHGMRESKNPDDDCWITVTGKHKRIHFQDMSGSMIAH